MHYEIDSNNNHFILNKTDQQIHRRISMLDTSFAIHPGNRNKIDKNSFHQIGNIQQIENKMDIFEILCENGHVNVQFYREDIVRVVMNPYKKPLMENTPAIVTAPEKVDVTMSETEEFIELRSNKLILTINKNPLLIKITDENGQLIVNESEYGMGYTSQNEVVCYKEMDQDDHFYGFGEKTSFLDKRGEKMTMWNSDVYAPHNPEIDSLYESIPYFMTLRNGKAHGIFFDNSFKSIFDMKANETVYSFGAEGGELNYYVFAGPTPKDVLQQYTDLTGRMPIPPKWAIGYHQSRYSYETEQEVRELVKLFLEKEIPLDAVYLDIHYMNGYRVFTFDKDRFPTPEKLIADLKEAGIKIVPIVDPGVKEDPEYPIYQEGILQNNFCKYLDGQIYYGDVWPGNSAFPDFTNTEVRKWWGEKHQFYTDLGIEGIWNDMNEPAVFNETKTMDVKVMHNKDGELKSHREMHNLYGLMMGESTYQGMKNLLNGKRPFLLTRAGYSGVQRYASVWTGDNRSFWEHLAMSIPMCMNLGISGVAFTGPDVGGFAHDTNAELLTRWTQVGAFYPYFRNHSALGTVRQEPWAFGEKYESVIKKYIQLRYQWLPQLYTLFAKAHTTGLPIMRPLFMEYPNDEKTFNLSDQFMIGDNVIVAPILQPNTDHRAVYLPEGQWVNYWNDEVYQGEQHILVNAPLDTLPIFVKAGSFILQTDAKQSTKFADKAIQVEIYPVDNGEYRASLYEDDGETFSYQEGNYLEKEIILRYSDSAIEIIMKDIVSNFKPSWDSLVFNLHGDFNKTIILNGNEIKKDDLIVDENKKRISIRQSFNF